MSRAWHSIPGREPGLLRLSSGFGEDTERGWLFRSAVSAPKRGGSMLPESSEPQGAAQTAGAAGWEWETASGEEGMAGALVAARGGARDGHKLGECLAHFCAPCAPCRPLTRAAPSLAGLSQFSVLAVLPFPAFVLAGCRLSLLGTAGTSPPSTAPPRPAGKLSTNSLRNPWLGFLGTPLGLGSSKNAAKCTGKP